MTFVRSVKRFQLDDLACSSCLPPFSDVGYCSNKLVLTFLKLIFTPVYSHITIHIMHVQ